MAILALPYISVTSSFCHPELIPFCHPEPAEGSFLPFFNLPLTYLCHPNEMDQYYTYIATNPHNTVFYTGITNNLSRRMFEHKSKIIPGFTSRYNICKLVWYDIFRTPTEAIAAEKLIKGWRREKKIALIKSMNPEFKDLAEEIKDGDSGKDPSVNSG